MNRAPTAAGAAGEALRSPAALLAEEMAWTWEVVNRLSEKAGLLPCNGGDCGGGLLGLARRQRWALEFAEPFLTAADPVPEE